jgi:hypothetical protein
MGSLSSAFTIDALRLSNSLACANVRFPKGPSFTVPRFAPDTAFPRVLVVRYIRTNYIGK